MTDPQMDERRAAHVRAGLVRFVESSRPDDRAAHRGIAARLGQWRVVLVTAVVVAVVVPLSVVVLTSTGSLGGRPAAPIGTPSTAYSGPPCSLDPVFPFECGNYRSMSGTDGTASVPWLAAAPLKGRFEQTGSTRRFILTGPFKTSTIVVGRTALDDGTAVTTGAASGDSRDATLDCASTDSDCGHQSWLLRFFDRPTTLAIRGSTLVIRSGAQSITFTDTDMSSPAPTAPTPPAVALLPVVWHVHDAAGEGTKTWLRFDAHEIDVLRPKGYVVVAWSTRGNAMLAAVSYWYSGLRGADTTVPWLTGSTRFVRDGAGLQLLDAAGRVTARLESDGPPPASKVILETPVTVTPAVRRALADVVLGTGAGVDSGASVVGTWAPPGIDPKRASITFTSTGTWSTIESCATGTDAVGTTGHYELAQDGWLLAGGGGRITVGCYEPNATAVAHARAIADIAIAGSVRVDSTKLTVFDRSGTALGTLIRVP